MPENRFAVLADLDDDGIPNLGNAASGSVQQPIRGRKINRRSEDEDTYNSSRVEKFYRLPSPSQIRRSRRISPKPQSSPSSASSDFDVDTNCAMQYTKLQPYPGARALSTRPRLTISVHGWPTAPALMLPSQIMITAKTDPPWARHIKATNEKKISRFFPPKPVSSESYFTLVKQNDHATENINATQTSGQTIDDQPSLLPPIELLSPMFPDLDVPTANIMPRKISLQAFLDMGHARNCWCGYRKSDTFTQQTSKLSLEKPLPSEAANTTSLKDFLAQSVQNEEPRRATPLVSDSSMSDITDSDDETVLTPSRSSSMLYASSPELPISSAFRDSPILPRGLVDEDSEDWLLLGYDTEDDDDEDLFVFDE